jgi:hypothetical protein
VQEGHFLQLHHLKVSLFVIIWEIGGGGGADDLKRTVSISGPGLLNLTPTPK